MKTVNRIVTCVKSVVESRRLYQPPETCAGGVRKGQGMLHGCHDFSKVSVTNGSEQVELAIVTACPEQLPDGISPSSPAKKVFLKAQDFLGHLKLWRCYKEASLLWMDG